MTKWGEGKVERICEYCNMPFFVYKAWTKGRQGRGGTFCSKECQIKGRIKKPPTKIEFRCKECNKIVSRTKHRIGKGEFCSILCMANYRGRMMAGSNHPKWNGGSSKRSHAERKIIKEQIKIIGKCEKCGSTDDLQGHHKLSYSKYPKLRTDPNNIEVICAECHAKEHPELEYFIKKKQGKPRYSKICRVCGTEYKAKSAKSTFCSHRCLFSLPPTKRKEINYGKEMDSGDAHERGRSPQNIRCPCWRKNSSEKISQSCT